MHHMLVGLMVKDDELYQQYRQAMMPILARFGGNFLYDVKVSEVLKAQSSEDFNRLFVIAFATEEQQQQFFVQPDYLAAKQEFFDASVESTHFLAQWSS